MTSIRIADKPRGKGKLTRQISCSMPNRALPNTLITSADGFFLRVRNRTRGCAWVRDACEWWSMSLWSQSDLFSLLIINKGRKRCMCGGFF
jgi:hypothetical protein